MTMKRGLSKHVAAARQPKRKPRHLWAFFVIPLLLVVALGAGIPLLLQGNGGSSGSTGTTDTSSLPGWLKAATGNVKTAYAYAVDKGDMLQYIPCFCGCGAHSGHLSNYNCFLASKPTLTPVYDEHGANCDMCVQIALDAKRMLAEGKSLKQVREYVVSQYGGLGPGTNTPPAP